MVPRDANAKGVKGKDGFEQGQRPRGTGNFSRRNQQVSRAGADRGSFV